MSAYFLAGNEASKIKDAMWEKVFSRLANPLERADLDNYDVSNLFLLAARKSGWPLPNNIGPSDSHYKYVQPDRNNLPEEIYQITSIPQGEKYQLLDDLLNGEVRYSGSIKKDHRGTRHYGNTGLIPFPEHFIDPILDWIGERTAGKEIQLERLTKSPTRKELPPKLIEYYRKHSEEFKKIFLDNLGLDNKQFKDYAFLDVFKEITESADRELIGKYNKARSIIPLAVRHEVGLPMDRTPKPAPGEQAIRTAAKINTLQNKFFLMSDRNLLISNRFANNTALSKEEIANFASAIATHVPEALAGYEKTIKDTAIQSTEVALVVEEKPPATQAITKPVEPTVIKTLRKPTEEKDNKLVEINAGQLTLTLHRKSLPMKAESEMEDGKPLSFVTLTLRDGEGKEHTAYLNMTTDAKALGLVTRLAETIEENNAGILQAMGILSRLQNQERAVG